MKYVIYYRKKPKTSLNVVNVRDQKGAVADFLARSPGEVVGEFVETERNRKHNDRVQLDKAIALAREQQATLVIARMNRLSRNVEVTATLQRATEAGLRFIALDAPTCNERTIHILAAVAQSEYTKVSERLKTAMQEAKARGAKFGSADPNHWKGIEHKRGWRKAVPLASKARSDKAARHYQYVLPEIKARRERGESLDDICQWLNNSGMTTTAGKPFTQTALWRLIRRSLGKEYLGKIKSPDHPLAHLVAGNS